MQVRKILPALVDLVVARTPLRVTRCLYAGSHGVLCLPIPKNANSYLRANFLLNQPDAVDFDPRRMTALKYLETRGSASLFPGATNLVRAFRADRIILLRDPLERFVSAFLDKVVKVRAVAQFDEQAFLHDLSRLIGFRDKLDNLTFSEFLDYVCTLPDWRRDRHVRSQRSFVGGLKRGHWFCMDAMNELVDFLESRGMELVPGCAVHRSVSKRTTYRHSDHGEPGAYAHVRLRDLRGMDEFPHPREFFDLELFERIAHAYRRDIEMYMQVRGLSWAEYRARYLANES